LSKTQIAGPIDVPESLRFAIRAESRCCKTADELLTKVGEDIWFCERAVAPHTDNLPDDLLTFGCIIINDAGHELVIGGQQYALPVGGLYRIDGRIEHGAVGSDGLFAVLIWDMPPDYSLADFERELHADPRFALPNAVRKED
jgi:hypothetical protein